MTNLTKKQQQELFLAEFLRRLREAPAGERVYMEAGDLFMDAEVHDLAEWRFARLGDDNEGEETPH